MGGGQTDLCLLLISCFRSLWSLNMWLCRPYITTTLIKTPASKSFPLPPPWERLLLWQNMRKGPIRLLCFSLVISYLALSKTPGFSRLTVFPCVSPKYLMTKIITLNSIDIFPCLNNHIINNFLLENANKPTVSPFLRRNWRCHNTQRFFGRNVVISSSNTKKADLQHFLPWEPENDHFV